MHWSGPNRLAAGIDETEGWALSEEDPELPGRSRTATSNRPQSRRSLARDPDLDDAEAPSSPFRLFSLGKALKHPLADYGFLLGACSLLLIIGLIMVLSSSTVLSLKIYQSSYTLFLRQSMFAVVGVVIMMLMSRLPVTFYRRIAYPAVLISGASLILVLVPGIGKSVNGQQNWISLGGPFQIQPSEFAKLALAIWIADTLYRKRNSVDGLRSLLLPLAPVAGAIVFLVLLEKDLGTCLVILPVIAAMLLVAGAPARLFVWMGAGVLALVALMTVAAPYRFARFASWLDPASDPSGTGYQVIHGQFALATGGWWGVGLGASREKWGFLPEAHTDFILGVIGEELGLMGTLSVLALFAVVAVVVVQVALKSTSNFVRIATTGVGTWIVAQALINIGAVLGMLPITGLPLPLVSYGGSSLTFTLMGVGMLLAFARAQPDAKEFLQRRADARRASQARQTKRRPTRRPRLDRQAQGDQQAPDTQTDLTPPRSSRQKSERRTATRTGRRKSSAARPDRELKYPGEATPSRSTVKRAGRKKDRERSREPAEPAIQQRPRRASSSGRPARHRTREDE